MRRQPRMRRIMLVGVLAALAAACARESPERAEAAMTFPSEEQAKIASAMSAAPEAVTRDATILDWPGSEGGEMRELRAGTNGWICLPDRPDTEGNDPMCMDQTWMGWMHALMSQAEPRIERVGISYMIGEGGVSTSNTDPFATGPTPDNEWGFDGPHLMILVPELAALEGLPTTRDSGGPYVMFAGTPYAHIMVPID